MAVDTYPHMALVWGGTLGTPAQEEWSCSMKLMYFSGGVPTTVPYDDQEPLLNIYQPLLVTWFTAAATKINAGAKMTFAKLNSIGEDGKYVYPNTTVMDFTGPTGASSTAVDWRQSLAITMRGESQRGKASTGRFYPPLVALNPEIASNPYVSVTEATAYMGTAKTLLDSINAADVSGTSLSSPPQVVLVGPRDTTKVGSVKVWNLVTYIEVDRVNDSQRRRTNRVARQVVTTNLG
jgi:hypothetical protein